MAARPRSGYEQHNARGELFTGGSDQRRPAVEEGANGRELDTMDNRQLVDKAVHTHKDTTDAAQRAHRITEEMKEIQQSTLQVLKDQGDQLERVDENFNKIDSDISYSEKILRFMRVCCCCAFFCSCCFEPEDEKDSKGRWLEPHKHQATAREANNGYAQYDAPKTHGVKQPKKRGKLVTAGQPATHANPNVEGLDKLGFKDEQRALAFETEKQNQYLDAIGKNLEQMKHGAQAMNMELARQDQNLTGVVDNADNLHSRLGNINKKTQLSDY